MPRIELAELRGAFSRDALERLAEGCRVGVVDVAGNCLHGKVRFQKQAACVLNADLLQILLKGDAALLFEFFADIGNAEIFLAADAGESDLLHVMLIHVIAYTGNDRVGLGLRNQKQKLLQCRNDNLDHVAAYELGMPRDIFVERPVSALKDREKLAVIIVERHVDRRMPQHGIIKPNGGILNDPFKGVGGGKGVRDKFRLKEQIEHQKVVASVLITVGYVIVYNNVVSCLERRRDGFAVPLFHYVGGFALENVGHLNAVVLMQLTIFVMVFAYKKFGLDGAELHLDSVFLRIQYFTAFLCFLLLFVI